MVTIVKKAKQKQEMAKKKNINEVKRQGIKKLLGKQIVSKKVEEASTSYSSDSEKSEGPSTLNQENALSTLPVYGGMAMTGEERKLQI